MFSQPTELKARNTRASGAIAAIRWTLLGGDPCMSLVASITTLPPSAGPTDASRASIAEPGTAKTTTSASPAAAEASSRPPKLTSWPASDHARPSVPPTLPRPITAMVVMALFDRTAKQARRLRLQSRIGRVETLGCPWGLVAHSGPIRGYGFPMRLGVLDVGANSV